MDDHHEIEMNPTTTAPPPPTVNPAPDLARGGDVHIDSNNDNNNNNNNKVSSRERGGGVVVMMESKDEEEDKINSNDHSKRKKRKKGKKELEVEVVVEEEENDDDDDDDARSMENMMPSTPNYEGCDLLVHMPVFTSLRSKQLSDRVSNSKRKLYDSSDIKIIRSRNSSAKLSKSSLHQHHRKNEDDNNQDMMNGSNLSDTSDDDDDDDDDEYDDQMYDKKFHRGGKKNQSILFQQQQLAQQQQQQQQQMLQYAAMNNPYLNGMSSTSPPTAAALANTSTNTNNNNTTTTSASASSTPPISSAGSIPPGSYPYQNSYEFHSPYYPVIYHPSQGDVSSTENLYSMHYAMPYQPSPFLPMPSYPYGVMYTHEGYPYFQQPQQQQIPPPPLQQVLQQQPEATSESVPKVDEKKDSSDTSTTLETGTRNGEQIAQNEKTEQTSSTSTPATTLKVEAEQQQQQQQQQQPVLQHQHYYPTTWNAIDHNGVGYYYTNQYHPAHVNYGYYPSSIAHMNVPGFNYSIHPPQVQEVNSSKYDNFDEGPEWSAEEDAQLIALVSGVNPQATQVNYESPIPGRTAEQCRNRWANHLDPSLNHAEWTSDEDETLLTLVKEHGTDDWFTVSCFLPGRSEKNVKIRYLSLTSTINTPEKNETIIKNETTATTTTTTTTTDDVTTKNKEENNTSSENNNG